jgi:Leucine-rich repeat (LRR) protein
MHNNYQKILLNGKQMKNILFLSLLWISQSVIGSDFSFKDLPPEVQYLITKQITPKDTYQFILVSKEYKDIINKLLNKGIVDLYTKKGMQFLRYINSIEDLNKPSPFDISICYINEHNVEALIGMLKKMSGYVTNVNIENQPDQIISTFENDEFVVKGTVWSLMSSAIGNFSNLTHLDLTNNYIDTEIVLDIIEYASKLEYLIHLNISNESFYLEPISYDEEQKDLGEIILDGFKNIEYLYLKNCLYIFPCHAKITTAIENLKKLKKWHISYFGSEDVMTSGDRTKL